MTLFDFDRTTDLGDYHPEGQPHYPSPRPIQATKYRRDSYFCESIYCTVRLRMFLARKILSTVHTIAYWVCVHISYPQNQVLKSCVEIKSPTSVNVCAMDALLRSNRVPEPHEATILSSMMNTERDSINSLDTRIHQLEQDTEMARQRIQKLTTQLEAETRGLRLHEDAIAELRTTRNALEQSIERKQAIISSRRRIPGEIWREIFLLLWGSEFQRRSKPKRPVSVALQVGAVCREWRDLAQTTTRLWSILDYTFSLKERVGERKLYHYLGHIGAATPYIILRKARSLLLPPALCQATTAAELVILLEHPDLQYGSRLTFPLSTPVFSHLCKLSIHSRQYIIQILSCSLRPFPSLDNLRLTNTEIYWLRPIIPHMNLKSLYIGGTWEGRHPWANVLVDIAMVAEWFSNLTDLTLDCDWHCDWQISTPQVVLHHVKSLCIRSSAITRVHRLTSRVSFPNLNKFKNRGKNMNGLVPLVQAWGDSVDTLVLSGLEPYDASSQHLSEILGDIGNIPRLSRLVFLKIALTRAIDLALVADAVIRRNESAANGQAELDGIKTIALPIVYNSDPNLNRLPVTVQWK